MPENLEKFRSTELQGAALERSTIFLCHNSLGCTSMESCQLADLKYAIFSITGCKNKKLPRSKLFLSMVFKLKLWLSIVPARRPSEHTSLGPPQKGVNCNCNNSTNRTALERFHLGRLNMEFQKDCPKDKKITALLIFCLET